MSSLLPTHTPRVLLLPRSFTGLWIFVWLNAFIHTVMYTYYAIAAAGIPYPAKPLITAMQITQFLGGFSLVWRYKNLPCFVVRNPHNNLPLGIRGEHKLRLRSEIREM